MVRRSLPLALALVACGGGPRPPSVPVARPRPLGALMLAHPGNAMPFAASPNDVVRGRVRYHVDADSGATRARDVLAEGAQQALVLPPSLGGGLALIADQGIALAGATLRPLVRGSLSSITLGVNELWARDRSTRDWVRIDLATGRAAPEPPPIAAPILTSWSTVGLTAGKAQTAGPELGAAGFALAVVDLLGPVISRDAGQTWAPLDAAAVRAAFPLNAPNRVVRDGTTLVLASDDRAVSVLSSGAFGPPVSAPSSTLVPDAAALRVEHVATSGVPLSGGDLLITDSGRFAVLSLDPVRVVRATRAPELLRCDLAASKHDLAVAVCLRHAEGVGGQLAVGAVVDESAPRLVVDRSFPYGTSHRFSATSALAVAATCAGTSEGGIDLLTATKICVRDLDGKWSDVTLPPLTGKRHLLARADGGVLIVRDDPAGRIELLGVSSKGIASPRLQLDVPPRELLSVDESAPGRFTLWRRGPTDLRALTVEVGGSTPELVREEPRAILDANTVVGTHADHALIASVSSQSKEPGRVEASVTSDAGRSWSVTAWPTDVRPLDLSPGGRRVECGAAGCRLLGWTRVGWHPTVSSYDRVVSLEDVSSVTAPPPSVTRSRVLRARCTSIGSAQPIAASSVPVATPSYPQQSNDVLLGLPAPKLPKDHVQVLSAFSARNVRGGYVSIGPINGPWGDKARTIARFASDLDPLGTVYETEAFASPFPDRLAAQTSWGARRFEASALGPGRVLVVGCTYGRCDVQRLVANTAPESIALGDVAMTKFVNARELGDTLAIFGLGTRRDLATPTRVVESLPFVALVDARGTTVSFLSRAGFGDAPAAVLTIDPTYGRFGLRSTTTVPSWTEGAAYVLRLGLDGRPAGAFEALVASSPEISRPTKACGPGSGWDEADVSQTRVLRLSVDGGSVLTLEALAGALRTRSRADGACLDRLTALSRVAAFQFDAATGRALHLSLDADGKGAKRAELSCSLEWE